MSEENQPIATLTYQLVASTGYECEGKATGISADHWGQICAAINEKPPIHLTELNEHTLFILGRPNFAMAGISSLLRKRGDVIANKAEDEQAHAIHFLLNMYEKHGDGWQEAAEEELRRINSSYSEVVGASYV